MDGLEILDDAEAVARAAADEIAATAQRVLAAADVCHIALPGGGTPARCLELLAAMQGKIVAKAAYVGRYHSPQ